MSPESRDVAYLWDMRDAAEAVYEFTKDVNFTRYIKERMC